MWDASDQNNMDAKFADSHSRPLSKAIITMHHYDHKEEWQLLNERPTAEFLDVRHFHQCRTATPVWPAPEAVRILSRGFNVYPLPNAYMCPEI
jgi:hypothetical protein